MYKVNLRKLRATWHWFTTNPQGGGFGSTHCGSKKVALDDATRWLKPGTQYQLFVNEPDCGLKTKEGSVR